MNKALELANRICPGLDWYEFDYQTWCVDAAAELRRLAALEQAIKDAQPVAHCALSIDGNHIAFFDGKPVVMVGRVGNEIHDTPLYTLKGIKP